jgi:flagellar biosynthesis/type III secretory pathway M-ring protein FliF/YscJ
VNAPPPSDPEITARVADVLELLAKVAGAAAIVWGFLAKVAKPWIEWRRATKAKARKELEAQMREWFKEELTQFGLISAVVPRIDVLFEDHDLLLELALDNRERHDETNELLDFLGFTSDRRTSDDRREKVSQMVHTLAERRRDRRRQGDA